MLARCLEVAGGRFLRDGAGARTGLLLEVANFARRLHIDARRKMLFGPESVTAETYFRRVIERGDLIDVVGRPGESGPDGSIPLDLFWIHIHYADPARLKPQNFREKEVGQFALRHEGLEKRQSDS